MTLEGYIADHREQLIERTREKVATRRTPHPTEVELRDGIPLFVDQLAARLSTTGESAERTYEAGQTLRGAVLLRMGLTVGQVVYDYGNICQAVTEIASEHGVNFAPEDFRRLNICLDIAIAEAVTEYVRIRDELVRGANVEKLGFLAHELRNLLSTATLAFDAVSKGQVGIKGKTSSLVDRSLDGMRLLADRALSEVRLESAPLNSERVLLTTLLEEIQIAATMHARRRDTLIAFGPIDPSVVVQGDSQILAAIVLNLVQNACKFTHAHGHVQVDARVVDDRVHIDVADECGGLPAGKTEELFRVFEQRGADRSGLGLGLAICLKGAHAMGGDVSVVNKPGHGCVFTLSVPRGAEHSHT